MSLIDRSLLCRQASPKQRPPTVLYVTDLTKPCLRSSYYGIVAKKPYDVESLRVFQAGNLLEEYWVSVLEEHPDYEVLATQVPVYHSLGDWEVHGRADVLVQHRRGPLVVHEIKSTRSLYYVKNEGKPKPDHLDQLNFYMVGLGVSRGQVDYLDKSALLLGEAPVDLSFRVEADEERFKPLVERAETLSRVISRKEPPQANSCWLCDYCLYREECSECD